jgi:hypothetical protein
MLVLGEMGHRAARMHGHGDGLTPVEALMRVSSSWSTTASIRSGLERSVAEQMAIVSQGRIPPHRGRLGKDRSPRHSLQVVNRQFRRHRAVEYVVAERRLVLPRTRLRSQSPTSIATPPAV